MPFAPVNENTIREELRIDEVSIEQGRNNKPSDSDTTFDSPQLAIVQEFKLLLDKALILVRQEARSVHAKLHKLSVDLETKPYSEKCKQIPSQLQGDLTQILADQRNQLQRTRLAERKLMRDLNFFRVNNSLHREAHSHQESRIFQWAILFAMIVVESLSNAYFFAEGSSLGYAGGWIQSIIVSLLVILVSSFIGGYLLPQLHHKKLKRNLLGGIGILICASALLLIILIVGHYRHLLTIDPETALNQALPHFKAGALTLDPMSLLFCGVSTAFAISAAIYGFKSDDPYPGYGDLDRRHKAAEDIYELEKKGLGEKLSTTISGARASIYSLESEVQNRVQEHGMLVPQVRALVLEFNSYADGLENRCNTLLTLYRNRNQEVRTAPPPHYFRERFTFGEQKKVTVPEIVEANGLLSRFAQIQGEVFAVATQVREQINAISKMQDELLVKIINEIEAAAKKTLETELAIGG